LSPWKGSFPYTKYAHDNAALERVFSQVGHIVARDHINAQPALDLGEGDELRLHTYMLDTLFDKDPAFKKLPKEEQEKHPEKQWVETGESTDFVRFVQAVAHNYAERTFTDFEHFVRGFKSVGGINCNDIRYTEANPDFLAGGKYMVNEHLPASKHKWHHQGDSGEAGESVDRHAIFALQTSNQVGQVGSIDAQGRSVVLSCSSNSRSPLSRRAQNRLIAIGHLQRENAFLHRH
jgi:hypothetical protein